MPTAPRLARRESRPPLPPLLSATCAVTGPNGTATRGISGAARSQAALPLSLADEENTLGWPRDEWMHRDEWRGDEEDIARDRRNAGIDHKKQSSRIEWIPDNPKSKPSK